MERVNTSNQQLIECVVTNGMGYHELFKHDPEIVDETSTFYNPSYDPEIDRLETVLKINSGYRLRQPRFENYYPLLPNAREYAESAKRSAVQVDRPVALMNIEAVGDVLLDDQPGNKPIVPRTHHEVWSFPFTVDDPLFLIRRPSRE